MDRSAALSNQNNSTVAAQPAPRDDCVNLNTASAEELKTLPGIGEVLAQRIIEFREKYGSFRRPQEIILIDGFSEKKFKKLAELICV